MFTPNFFLIKTKKYLTKQLNQLPLPVAAGTLTN